VGEHGAPAQRGLDRRGAAAAERVVNAVALAGEALDEIGRELRLEAGAVRDLVDRAALALAAGPELAFVYRHRGRGSGRCGLGGFGLVTACDSQFSRGVPRG